MAISPIITSFDTKEQQKDGVVLTLNSSTKTLLPASQWPELSFNELIEQKNILYDKWDFFQNIQNEQLSKDFGKFLIDIDLFIQSKF